jgi:hypothetical protein
MFHFLQHPGDAIFRVSGCTQVLWTLGCKYRIYWPVCGYSFQSVKYSNVSRNKTLQGLSDHLMNIMVGVTGYAIA